MAAALESTCSLASAQGTAQALGNSAACERGQRGQSRGSCKAAQARKPASGQCWASCACQGAGEGPALQAFKAIQAVDMALILGAPPEAAAPVCLSFLLAYPSRIDVLGHIATILV